MKKSADGTPLTGLTIASSGLIIGTIADNEATSTAYTQAGSTIETITTLGTFAAPTATKCRFKEIDATNHPGDYEIQIADARFAVSNAKKMLVSISGFATLLATDYEVMLASVNWFSLTAFITGINSLAPPTNWNLLSINGSGLVDILQSAADKVWSTAARILTAGTNIVLAKGTGLTGLNDIAATAVVSNGAITTSSGKVSEVSLTDTLTTYTGNTPQTADVATLIVTIGAACAGVATAVWGAAARTLTAFSFTVATNSDSNVTAIKAKTDNLPASPASTSDVTSSTTTITTLIAALNNLPAGAAMTLTSAERNAVADALLVRSLGTEAVSADGAVPTVAQAFFELLSSLGEFSIVGTTITCKKRDHSTTLFTSTIDSATVPTLRTRAT